MGLPVILIDVREIFDGVPEIFELFNGDICWVFWRYSMLVLEIIDRFLGDI